MATQIKKGQPEWQTVPPRKRNSQKASPLPSPSIMKPHPNADFKVMPSGGSSSSLPPPTAGGNAGQSLSEEFMQNVAKNLHAKKWKHVFRDLMSNKPAGVPSADVLIGDIEKDHQGDVVERKYQALRKWKSVMGDGATWEKLKATLEKNGCPYGDEESHHMPPPGATSKSKQEHSGARPKEKQQTKRQVRMAWDGQQLSIQTGANKEMKVSLQGRLDEDRPTLDPITIADAMLVSIINPNHSDNKYKMGLDEVKERFHFKYGKMVSFKDFGLGGIESFVMCANKSRCLKLIEEEKKYIVQEMKEGSKRVLDKYVSDSGSETESELGDYETATEMSSTCPSPACLQFGQDDDTPWQLPKNSPMPKKQRKHSTEKKTPARKRLYCQSTSQDELQHLVRKCEGSHLIFRTEEEYTGENSSEVFTKDAVALWNTPRKGSADAYIVVGIKAAPLPPHDLQGLKQTGRVNEDYQEKFISKSFSYKPQFLYSEAEHFNKTFGVVCIANGKGFGDVCFAEDTCSDGEWSQNDILYRDGSSSVCATRKVQGQIYSWFNERHSLSSPKDYMDKDWELFIEQLDVENHQRRSYCLLVSRCSSETPDLPTVGHFPWFKVWDFDPDSRESGLLAVCEADIQDRISVRTWKDPPQTSLSNSFTEWLFVRGLRKREDSLVLGKVKEWGKQVGVALNAQCDQIRRVCEKKPLTVVVLWYGNKDCLRHLHKALGKIDECPGGTKFVICMQKIPDDEGSRGVVKELCLQLEIQKIIEIPLERLCFGLCKLSCCQRNSVVSLELPGSTLINSRESQWLQQELDVLYKGDLPTDDISNQGEAFLKGGNLTWLEIQQDVYDAKRTVSSKLNAFLQERLHKGFSCTASLFHEPGAGGTTLSRRILWDLHEQFPCAVAIADVIDPDEIYQRLEMLHQRTHLPILLLVDGQESRLVKELFAISHNIHIIILNVQRYTMEIRKKTQQGDRFWLKGEVDKNEADRFRLVFSQRCKGDTKKKLEHMVHDVKEEVASHYVYEFGLTVYDTEYIGLRSYVSGYLELQSSEGLTTWQRAVGYLALAFYYGHQSIPCQFFSILFGKKESDVVKADDVLTHSGKQFVLEDIRNCTWRITHHAVAKEILEQILYGRQNDSKDIQLSNKARRNLKKFAKEFLTYASKKQQKSKFDNTSSIMRIVRGIFIHRDYKDTGQDEHSKRDRLSRLICDIPGSKTYQDQLDLMEHLVACFPNDPTCVLHLGRAQIILTQNYDLAQTYLVQAKDLRTRERKANQDKYDRMSGDKSNEGISESDSILCTIYHHLGNLSHERIKNLIGGGKPGVNKQYKHTLDDTNGILREVRKQACTAINHFTSCRRFLIKGMDASYGYIGEIKLHLHIADFVEKCYKPDGYYGFLTAEGSDAELTDFVESCFVGVESLLREYQDLMSLTGQAEAEELDICQNWFSAIFHDAERALEYWRGKEGVDSNRSKIAVYKLKNQKDHKASARKSPAQILNNINAEDVPKIIELYEGIFRDAYMRSVRTDISIDLKDWMVAIRHPQTAAIYSIAGKVLPQVEKCWEVSRSSATALYYLYVLNTTLALQTQQKKYLAESNRLLEKLKKVHSKINRHQRIYAWEWLGVDKGGGSIRRLVHRSCLGVWDSEKRFWLDEKAQEKLQICTGVITNCKMPLHGYIGITTGDLKVGHHNGSLEAVFVPKQCGLFGKNYLNTEVEFYVGFNIEHGIGAYNVLELKKYACKHCRITISLSRLIKPSTKICPKCNHAVRVPVES